jgi:eukaryotic-like serine/threonine-protein kinase
MIGLESFMDAERWRKVEGLFHAAFERGPDARHAFLDVACAGDADLRQQVELLPTKEEQAGGFLETPAMLDMTVTQTATTAVPGRQLGPYRIESLGRRGVWERYIGRMIASSTATLPSRHCLLSSRRTPIN